MNLEDKKFTFKSSVAGGFIAGGTLLAYQILLAFGWGLLWAFIGAVITGLIITGLSKKMLFK